VGYSKPNEAHNDFINAKKRDTAQLAANPECEKKFISAFGRGKRAFHFSELPWDPQQTACQQDGYYHKYSIQDLQQAASGALIDGDREAGHFAIRRSMSSGRATISLDIAMQDQHYTIKEASLFIDCTSGIDDSIYDPSIASYEPSICKLESHPYRQTIKPYIGSAHFDIRDTLSCRNGYYVVIHAIICSKDVWGPRCYERETQC
jgi:hypothetical protein